jgi:simple sugar transport system ATP-binding protein
MNQALGALASPEPSLSVRGIVKQYPGVLAVDGVDLDVFPGEIHALCGENGAGKTTLAEIAAGKLRATRGEVRARGSVGLVHQHFELVERLRVWENVVLGSEPRRGGRLDAAAARERVRGLSSEYGLEVDPDAVVETLPVGIAQRVEVLRELSRSPSVLILDEPTAVLAPAEIEAFFATVRALAGRGAAILIVTHKLQEVVALTQRVTVMRAGRVAARFETARTSVEEIARAMVGGDVPALAARAATEMRALFSVRDLCAGDAVRGVRGVSFEVRSGEIVGIAGVEGNGQTALADAIAGTIEARGRVVLDGVEMTAGGPAARIGAGVRTIPQDRRREGLVEAWSIAENVALGDQRGAFRAGLRFDRRAAEERAKRVIAEFDVRAPSAQTTVSALSGGNQQKVVVGRALAGEPRLVVAYQPTRGIDVGAAALVQSRLIEARNRGAGVLLISFELDELFACADRVLVLFRGKVAGEFARGAFDRARIGALMAGATA